jgi:hypothetical protein
MQHIFMPPSIFRCLCKPGNIIERGCKCVPRHSTGNTCKRESGHIHSGGPDGGCCNGSPQIEGDHDGRGHAHEGSGSGGKGQVHEGNSGLVIKAHG